MESNLNNHPIRLYQQIMLIVGLFFCFPVLSPTQTVRPPVYQGNGIIGYLYTETTIDDCENCYTLDTLDVLGRQVIIRLDVNLAGINEDVSWFSHDVEIYEELKLTEKEFLLSFRSTLNGNFYKIFFQKDKKGTLYISRKQWFYPSAQAKIEIAENDFEHFQATHICNKFIHKKIDEPIDFSDLFYSDDIHDDNPKNCFDCPIQYSWEECLEMKAKNKKFIWKQE